MDLLTDYLVHADAVNLQGKCYQFTGKVQSAENCYIQASQICPNRFEYRHGLFQLYVETCQLDKARTVALRTLNIKEKKPSPYTLAVKLEMEHFLNETMKQK
jgi:hypothetical protein